MKTRLLFTIESFNIGGAERALLNLLTNLDKHLYDITLLVVSDVGGFSCLAHSIPGIKIKCILKSGNGSLSRIKNKIVSKFVYSDLFCSHIYRMFYPKNCDVEIAFCEGYLTKWGSYSNGSGKKIAWVHTDLLNNNWPIKTQIFNSQSEQLAYGKYDLIIGVSKAVSDGLKKKFSDCQISTLYNIVDIDENHSITKNHELNSDNKVFTIVSVGRQEYIKGYDRLIKAFATVRESTSQTIKLIVVGGGSQLHDNILLAKHLGISDDIIFTGQQSNPYKFIKNADMFVCPSREEGFNIAILEALSFGLPVVSTACTGPSEILDGGKYGLLTENNTESLASGILKLLKNPAKASEYSNKSQFRYKYFDKNVQIRNFNTIIHDLLTL